MPTTDSFLPFALTTVGICVPTYLLIVIVNNPETSRKLLANVGLLFTAIASIFAPKKSKKVREKILEHKFSHHGGQATVHKSATFASLDGRLSQDLAQGSSLLGSQGLMQATRRMSQSIAQHLHGSSSKTTAQNTAQIPPKLSTFSEESNGYPGSRRRSDAVKFDEPFSSPPRWQTDQSQVVTVHDFEKSNSDISAISPTEGPAVPAVVLTTVDGMSSPPAVDRRRLRAPESRRDRSRSPLGGSGRRSLFGRLTSRISSALPSPRTSQPGTPKESV